MHNSNATNAFGTSLIGARLSNNRNVGDRGNGSMLVPAATNKKVTGRLTPGLRAIMYSYLTLDDFMTTVSRVSRGERALLSNSFYKRKFLDQRRVLRVDLDKLEH